MSLSEYIQRVVLIIANYILKAYSICANLILSAPYQHDLENRQVLLVIAHPDDEAMFFTPLLSSSEFFGFRTKILCLSTGMLLIQGIIYYQLYTNTLFLGILNVLFNTVCIFG